MENNGGNTGMAQMGLSTELVHGRDLAKRLQLMLLKHSSSPSNGARNSMIQRIIDSFERSIEILKSHPFCQHESQINTITTRIVDSPPFSGSPKNQDSDGDSKHCQDLRGEYRKRRSFPIERKIVPGCSGTGLEGPVENGFNWRKYGGKDILGAKHPKSYYRCTMRQVQGCLATKQVQRTDDDPTFFTVTYRGKHTCNQFPTLSSLPTHIKPEPNETLTYPSYQQQQHDQVIWSFETDQNHDNKPIITNNKHLNPSSFSFPSLSNPVASASTTNSPVISPEFSFDQGEFDHDIMFDSNDNFFS